MKNLLFTALVAISLIFSARADMQVVVNISNQTAWLEDDERILLTSPVLALDRRIGEVAKCNG